MIDIRLIRHNPDQVRHELERRGAEGQLVDRVLALDKERRRLVTQLDDLRHRRNVLMQTAAPNEQPPPSKSPTAATRELAQRIRTLRQELKKAEQELAELLRALPNLPHPSVPPGMDPSADRIVKQEGAVPRFDFEPQTHEQLAEKLGVLDFCHAVELAGKGQVYFLGAGSRLVRALVDFMLAVHTRSRGYLEVRSPLVCTAQAAWQTAHLPAMASGMYALAKSGYWLVPDGEVPLMQLVAHRTIDTPLPLRLAGWSVCFRDAGRHARGLLRMHQFESVELLKCVEAATEMREFEMLVQDVTEVLQRLEVPYRIVELCAGRLSFAAQKAFRIDVWAAGQKAWLAVSTCRSYGDFLARRAGVRYRDEAGRVRFVHSMGAAGVALPHLMVALLENGQTRQGTVRLPQALWPFINGARELGAGER